MTTDHAAPEVRAAFFREALTNAYHRVLDMEPWTTESAAGVTDTELADWVAAIQDIRRKLLDVEHDLATALGHRLGKFVGTLSDGRQFTLDRANDRKEWQHDEWKRDARRVIAEQCLGPNLPSRVMAVDAETGAELEEVNLVAMLYDALNMAQEVHGSTAPRSRALKELGLFASDYATSTPSGWRFAAVKPTATETQADG